MYYVDYMGEGYAVIDGSSNTIVGTYNTEEDAALDAQVMNDSYFM